MGYLINIFMSQTKWRFGLLIETILIMVCVVILIFIPDKYLNKAKKTKKNGSILSLKDNQNITYERYIIENDSYSEPEIKNFTIIKKLLLNLTFICMSLFKSNVFFFDVAQTYWFADYIEEFFSENNPKIIVYAYFFSLIFSQIVGMILCGYIGIIIIGGSASPKNLPAMLLFQITCCIFVTIAANVETLLLFSIFNGFAHFFNNMASLLVIPFTLELFDIKFKGIASDLFFFFIEVFSFLPAPYAYGILKSYLQSGQKAMKILFYNNFIGLFLLLIAYFNMSKIS